MDTQKSAEIRQLVAVVIKNYPESIPVLLGLTTEFQRDQDGVKFIRSVLLSVVDLLLIKVVQVCADEAKAQPEDCEAR